MISAGRTCPTAPPILYFLKNIHTFVQYYSINWFHVETSRTSSSTNSFLSHKHSYICPIVIDLLISAGPEQVQQLHHLRALAPRQVHRGVEQRLRHGDCWTSFRRLLHISGTVYLSFYEIMKSYPLKWQYHKIVFFLHGSTPFQAQIWG